MSSIQVDRIIAALRKTAERFTTKVSLDIHANLVAAPPAGTPILTSWASANWMPSIGATTRSVGGAGGPGRDSKSGRFKSRGAERSAGEVASAQASQQAGIAKILGYRLGMGSIFVANNVPYVVYLNRGSSSQTPAKFVERAVEKALLVDSLGLSR